MSFGIGNVGRSFNNQAIQGDTSEKRRMHQEEDGLGVEQRRFEQKAMGLNIEEAKAKHEEALMDLGVPEEIIQEGPKAVKEYIDTEGLENLDNSFGSIFGLKIGFGKAPKGEGEPPMGPPPQGAGERPMGPPPQGQGQPPVEAEQNVAGQASVQDFSFNLAYGTDDFSLSQVEILESLDIPEEIINEGKDAVSDYIDFENIKLPEEDFSFLTAE